MFGLNQRWLTTWNCFPSLRVEYIFNCGLPAPISTIGYITVLLNLNLKNLSQVFLYDKSFSSRICFAKVLLNSFIVSSAGFAFSSLLPKDPRWHVVHWFSKTNRHWRMIRAHAVQTCILFSVQHPRCHYLLNQAHLKRIFPLNACRNCCQSL